MSLISIGLTASVNSAEQTADVKNDEQFAWTPAKIKPQLWYDASDPSTIIASEEGRVSQWNDKSGNGIHLTASGEARPTTASETINGRNVVVFDGRANVMMTDSNPFAPTITDAFVFMVVNIKTQANGVLFGLSRDGADTSTRWQAYFPLSNGSFYFDAGGTGGTKRVVYGPSPAFPDGKILLAGLYDSVTDSVHQLWLGGTLASGFNYANTVTAVGNVSLGADSAPGNFDNCAIAEFIAIKGTVSEVTRKRIEGYLAHKWGLTGDLPADHINKKLPPQAETAEELLGELASGDINRVNAASESLIHAGPMHIPALIEGLVGTKDPFVRLKIVDVFAGIGGGADKALPVLSRLVTQDKGAEREHAARAINRILSDQMDGSAPLTIPDLKGIVAALVTDFSHEDPTVQDGAGRTVTDLAPFLDAAARNALIPIYNSHNEGKVALALVELASTDAERVNAATESLVKAGPVYVPFLAKELVSTEDTFVQMKLCELFARLRSKARAALPELIRVVQDEKGWIRERAAQAINWIVTDPEMTESEILAKQWILNAVPALLSDLGHDDPKVREMSARAVALLVPCLDATTRDSLIPALIDLTKDGTTRQFPGYWRRPETTHFVVQEAAVWALEQMGLDNPRVNATLSEYYGKKLFALVDLTKGDLEEVSAAVTRNDYKKALELYKVKLVKRLAARPFPEEPGLWWIILPADQLLSNLIAANNYGSPIKRTRFVGAPGAMEWFINEPTNSSWADQSARMTWPAALIHPKTGGFMQSGDPVYLRHWLAIYSDFDSNYRHQLEQGSEVYRDREVKVIHSTMDGGWHWPFQISLRLGGRIGSLAASAKAYPEVTINSTSDIRMAKLLLGAVTEITRLSHWLGDENVDVYNVPSNQMQTAAKTSIQAIAALSDFKMFPEWMDTMSAYATKLIPYYPDGTELEQSFAYNGSLIGFVRESVSLFPQGSSLPFIDQLVTMGLYRYRFLSSLVRPNDGMCPGEGMVEARLQPEFQSTFNDPLVGKIISATQKQTEEVPAFDSIAFPYSGYYILRDGWHKNDMHLYLKGGRKGIGHKSASANQLQLTAFGRAMLIRAGRRSYGAGPFKGHNDYQMGSFGYNTIVVDGQSQRGGNPNDGNAPLQPDPIPSRWLSSDVADFTESSYASGYLSIDENIVHGRQVIFLKKFGLFVVTDRIRSDKEREYTQIWHFAKEYAEDQVVPDPNGQTIFSADPAGPNVELYQVAPGPLSYTKYYGQKEPEVRGWVGVEPHFPAVDVHASWKGSGAQQLITVMSPKKMHESAITSFSRFISDDVSGFTLVMKDGSTIAYRSATRGTTALDLAGISTQGEALLVSRDADGQFVGIALGATDVTVSGKAQNIAQTDFMFTLYGETLTVERELRTPTGFTWEETEAGFVPNYEPTL